MSGGGRLATHVEASAIIRRVEAAGGFGTVLRKGDAERGSLLLVISSRGSHRACLERILDLGGGGYAWRRIGPAESSGADALSEFIAKRLRFDADGWVVELDIADAERFIAETTAAG